MRPDVESRHEAGPVLALPADVEEAAAESEGNGDPREDERCHEDERLLEVVCGVLTSFAGHPREEPVEARALEDGLVGAHGVVPGKQDDKAADQEGERRRGKRDEDAAESSREPLRHRRLSARRLGRPGRHAACFRPPVIAIPSSSSETPGSYSPTIRPSSRSFTSRRWTNSIAPTSSPRVGCAATRIRGSRETSRTMTTFCWFPPERAAASVCGLPPRTSNSFSSRAARSIRRPGYNHPHRELGFFV